ncbi:MAG: hypothetical protein JWN45_2289 [Acidobacteriaceae bacterium]|nr:hypothetical protein [Acidobacteriaceae bacterium]
MTISTTETNAPPRGMLRSVGAVFAGIVAIFVLSLGTDQVLHVMKVYPPWTEPMFDPRLNLLALSYRIVYGVVGGYITARLAPRYPMRHAIVLGAIGLALSTAGAIAAIPMNLGPSWYPILLALSSMPCAWLGGVLQRRWHTQ